MYIQNKEFECVIKLKKKGPPRLAPVTCGQSYCNKVKIKKIEIVVVVVAFLHEG